MPRADRRNRSRAAVVGRRCSWGRPGRHRAGPVGVPSGGSFGADPAGAGSAEIAMLKEHMAGVQEQLQSRLQSALE
eukprot:10037655-Alexandrium_andersonii.AAC.1